MRARQAAVGADEAHAVAVREWLALLAFLNVPVIAAGLVWLLADPADWRMLIQVGDRLGSRTLYEHTPFYTWVWSPPAAWLVAAVVVPAGYWVLFSAKAVLLPLLGWHMGLAVALSLPFWIDAVLGNFFLFPVVAGVLALRGSTVAALAFVALTCLMPRPVQLPLLIWLLSTRSGLWLPSAGIALLFAVVTLASGHAGEWIAVMTSLAGTYPTPEVNVGPTRFLGPAWLIVGVPLAIVLTIRGRPGWAGLALSPYVVPQYLLAVLWELAHRWPAEVVPAIPAVRRLRLAFLRQ